jgi:hypothetical protein
MSVLVNCDCGLCLFRQFLGVSFCVILTVVVLEANNSFTASVLSVNMGGDCGFNMHGRFSQQRHSQTRSIHIILQINLQNASNYASESSNDDGRV